MAIKIPEGTVAAEVSLAVSEGEWYDAFIAMANKAEAISRANAIWGRGQEAFRRHLAQLELSSAREGTVIFRYGLRDALEEAAALPGWTGEELCVRFLSEADFEREYVQPAERLIRQMKARGIL